MKTYQNELCFLSMVLVFVSATTFEKGDVVRIQKYTKPSTLNGTLVKIASRRGRTYKVCVDAAVKVMEPHTNQSKTWHSSRARFWKNLNFNEKHLVMIVASSQNSTVPKTQRIVSNLRSEETSASASTPQKPSAPSHSHQPPKTKTAKGDGSKNVPSRNPPEPTQNKSLKQKSTMSNQPSTKARSGSDCSANSKSKPKRNRTGSRAPSDAISPGVRVRVHGLTAYPEFNGKQGVVKEVDNDIYKIDLDDNGQRIFLNIYRKNILPLKNPEHTREELQKAQDTSKKSISKKPHPKPSTRKSAASRQSSRKESISKQSSPSNPPKRKNKGPNNKRRTSNSDL